jgi:transporter family-2 protein
LQASLAARFVYNRAAMNLVILIPVCLGAGAVAQAAMNRQIAERWGLAPAAILNTSVAIACSLGLLAYCLASAARVGLLRVSFDVASFRAWWLLPGLFGFGIVVGLPWAVGKAGALPTFVSLVAAQMVTSALWDRFVYEIPLNASRAVGAALAVASVLLVSNR